VGLWSNQKAKQRPKANVDLRFEAAIKYCEKNATIKVTPTMACTAKSSINSHHGLHNLITCKLTTSIQSNLFEKQGGE